jgi:hypothetical protein
MWSQLSEGQHTPPAGKQAYAGVWWAAADSEERSGFLNGVADCMTWAAHKSGFSATPGQLIDKITRFYRAHPKSADLPITEVWQRVEGHSNPVKDKDEAAETWKNPHWYLNGGWWMQISERQQLGFVEGYLWCIRSQVKAGAENYPHSATSYQRKIDTFVRANPKLSNEAVADTLRRFQDRVQTAVPE